MYSLLMTKLANVVLAVHPCSDAPMLVDTMKFCWKMLSDACCSVECFCYKQPISYRTPILMKDMRRYGYLYREWKYRRTPLGMQSIGKLMM